MDPFPKVPPLRTPLPKPPAFFWSPSRRQQVEAPEAPRRAVARHEVPPAEEVPLRRFLRLSHAADWALPELDMIRHHRQLSFCEASLLVKGLGFRGYLTMGPE